MLKLYSHGQLVSFHCASCAFRPEAAFLRILFGRESEATLLQLAHKRIMRGPWSHSSEVVMGRCLEFEWLVGTKGWSIFLSACACLHTDGQPVGGVPI